MQKEPDNNGASVFVLAKLSRERTAEEDALEKKNLFVVDEKMKIFMVIFGKTLPMA